MTDYLKMIESLLKLGNVKSVKFGTYSVQGETPLEAVEFYPTDAMQDLLKRAAAAGDTTLIDVVKDLISAQERGE